jgi:hypothetical protein
MRFVPVTQLEQAGVNARWDISLPEYSGVDGMVLDTRTLNALTSLGILANVSFEAGIFQRPQESAPGISGVNAGGTATAARTLSLSRAPKQSAYTVELERHWHEGQPMPFWRDATVLMNVTGLTNRLNKRHQLRNPQAWAAGLDNMAWRGLYQAARTNVGQLFIDEGIVNAFQVPIMGSTIAWVASGVWDKMPSFGDCVPFGMVTAAGLVAWLNHDLRRGQGREAGLANDQIPFVLLPFGLDRLGRIGLASLRHHRLIRYRPENKEAPTPI